MKKITVQDFKPLDGSHQLYALDATIRLSKKLKDLQFKDDSFHMHLAEALITLTAHDPTGVYAARKIDEIPTDWLGGIMSDIQKQIGITA